MARENQKQVRDRDPVRRRNPIAKALIERAMGVRVVPGRKRYTRKLKHRKRAVPEQE